MLNLTQSHTCQCVAALSPASAKTKNSLLGRISAPLWQSWKNVFTRQQRDNRTCDIPVSCRQNSLSVGFSSGWTYSWNSASTFPDRVFSSTAGNSTAQQTTHTFDYCQHSDIWFQFQYIQMAQKDSCKPYTGQWVMQKTVVEVLSLKTTILKGM